VVVLRTLAGFGGVVVSIARRTQKLATPLALVQLVVEDIRTVSQALLPQQKQPLGARVVLIATLHCKLEHLQALLVIDSHHWPVRIHPGHKRPHQLPPASSAHIFIPYALEHRIGKRLVLTVENATIAEIGIRHFEHPQDVALTYGQLGCREVEDPAVVICHGVAELLRQLLEGRQHAHVLARLAVVLE
jgi:hypothetical protein